MAKVFSRLSLIACLAFATPALAQDESGDTIAPEDQLAVGEEVQEGPQIGQTYIKEEIGDWELRCVRTDNPEQDPCQLYQLLKEEDGNPISEISLFRLPDGSKLPAGATIIVPLETLLTGALGISVDGAQPKSYPYSFCNKVGCYARIGLTEEDIAAYKRGAQATVMLRPFKAPDQVVTSIMSLKGFTAGYDKVTKTQQ